MQTTTSRIGKACYLRYLIVSLLLTLTACSDDIKLQPLSEQATVLAFGDSLTYGTGTSHDYAYPAILQSRINREVINAGIPGEISSRGLIRLPALLKQHHPELVIICHGGNDILRKLDLIQTRDNIQQMIEIAQAHDAQVVLIGVPQFGLFLDSAPFYQSLAEHNRLAIENDILGDILRKNTLKSDHIHPNSQGYQLLAQSIESLLRASGAI